MSTNGDVVWANGASWQRDNSWEQEPKQWWICPFLDDLSATLKELKKYPDFAWVVLDGELVRQGEPGEEQNETAHLLRLQVAKAQNECDIFRAVNTTLRNKLVEAEHVLLAEQGACADLKRRVENLQSTLATDAEEVKRLHTVVAEQGATISRMRSENPNRYVEEQAGNVEHVGFSDWLKQQTVLTGGQDTCDAPDRDDCTCVLPANHRGPHRCTCCGAQHWFGGEDE